MNRGKKTITYCILITMLLSLFGGTGSTITLAEKQQAAGIVANAVPSGASDVSGNASGDVSGNASGDASGDVSGDASGDAYRFVYQGGSFARNLLLPGEMQELTVSADAELKHIKYGMLTATLRVGADGSLITRNLTYDSVKKAFFGSFIMDDNFLLGSYQLVSVSFTGVPDGKVHMYSITDSKAVFTLVDKLPDNTILVSGITLPAGSITLREGQTKQLVPKIAPDNASNSAVSYKSSNKKVVTVSNTGLLTAIKQGTATITITAKDGSGVKATCKIKVERNLVIVLDPGHGKSDVGAVNRRHRLYERDVNLKVAKACRNYLEENYEGVTVFLTRETNNGFLSLKGRAKFAQACDADVLISLHQNASVSHRSTGAEVWVTRSTAKAGYHKEMKKLGNKILSQLVNRCGFRKRGVYTRKSGYLKYSNGQRADYYGVIRESIYLGIPAMIVEHGYIDSSDYSKMNSNAKTKKMGVADAIGIASYYGLEKKNNNSGGTLVTSIKLNVNDTSLALKKSKTYKLKATIAPSNAVIKSVSYSSSNKKVVTVSSSGKLTAKKKGTATITCMAKDGSGVVRKLKVKVK